VPVQSLGWQCLPGARAGSPDLPRKRRGGKGRTVGGPRRRQGIERNQRVVGVRAPRPVCVLRQHRSVQARKERFGALDDGDAEVCARHSRLSSAKTVASRACGRSQRRSCARGDALVAQGKSGTGGRRPLGGRCGAGGIIARGSSCGRPSTRSSRKYSSALGRGRAPSGADPKVRVLTRQRPRQDSNLRTRLRRPVLYPLSYEGVAWRGYSTVGCGQERRERQGGLRRRFKLRRRFVDRAEGRRHPRGARPPVPDRLGLSTGAGRRRCPRAGRERPTKPPTIGNWGAPAEAESGSRKAHGRVWAFPVVAGGGATRRWPTRGGSEEGWR